MYRTANALRFLFDAINLADGFYELLAARRTCELVLANEIKRLNDVVETILR